MMFRLEEAARGVEAHGIAAQARGDAEVRGVSTDSRGIGAGELFIALRGERFDGHGYVAAARERGACAAMIEAGQADGVAAANPGLPLIVVEDTRLGLGALAAWWRSRYTLPLVAVTGSNGKTTTKEMIAAIFRARACQEGLDPERAVLATGGNLNNDIGLPLTLLRLDDRHRYAVVEMGMNHPGEIAYLTRIAKPTVALVTNAQRAHLEGMGDLDAVAREKGSIYDGLNEAGVAVVNADDSHAGYWRGINAGRRVVAFGLTQGADVAGRVSAHGLAMQLELEAAGETRTITLRIPGLHNARNALAAAAAALNAGTGMDAVAAGLAAFSGVKGRLQLRPGCGGAQIIDDTYNANPDSVRAAIDVLAATVGRKVLVLGDMGEIGECSGQFHDEVGGYAKSQGIDLLFTLGEHAAAAARNFGEGARHFEHADKLALVLRSRMDEETVVLVKGSRFMRMERVVEAVARDAALEKNTKGGDTTCS